MIYTEQTQNAMKLCYQAHAGQSDKSGVPYVLHPVHLAEQMDDEISTVVALLHDVVEDTEYTFTDLEQMGFAPEAIEALKLMTHDMQTDYLDYVRNLAENPIARKVKMADLMHNLDAARLKNPSERMEQKRVMYRKALKILKEAQPVPVDYSLPHIPVSDTDAAALKKMQNRKSRDQIRGSLIGGAAGDALGYEVEFIHYDEIVHQFGPDGIRDYVLDNGYARFSDDTQMTLYTAAGLLYGTTRFRMRGIGGLMETYIHRAYLDWLETQHRTGKREAITWLNNIKPLYAWRAPGNTCLSALGSGKMGSVENPINNSKGCGGVMRVAPIGLYFKNTREPGKNDQIQMIMELGGEAAAITHGHPLGYIPAAALVHIINRIVYGGCKYGQMPAQILRECKELLVELYGDTVHVERMNRLIDRAAELSAGNRADHENIHALGGGWVGEEALAIALYCWLKYPADFDKALIASVNHSGDADSTGAILGNIMGAVFGYEAISRKWKENLELHDVILEIADDLCDDCRMSEYGSYRDQVWEEKYIHHTYVTAKIQG